MTDCARAGSFYSITSHYRGRRSLDYSYPADDTFEVDEIPHSRQRRHADADEPLTNQETDIKERQRRQVLVHDQKHKQYYREGEHANGVFKENRAHEGSHHRPHSGVHFGGHRNMHDQVCQLCHRDECIKLPTLSPYSH